MKMHSKSLPHLVRVILSLLVFCFLLSDSLVAQSSGGSLVPPVRISLDVDPTEERQDIDMGIQVLFIITLLSLAPSILLLMTSFTRIVIVLSFIRSALSLQGAPSNQIVIGLAFFITLFVMSPTWNTIHANAIEPYSSKAITSEEALSRASLSVKEFMLRQTRPEDLELFVVMSGRAGAASETLPLNVVIPGFVISELRTAFQMGFLLFIPFIMIDLIVATVLMSMGMMMMPPVTVSLPLKILLFVLVDGWNLIVQSIVESFSL